MDWSAHYPAFVDKNFTVAEDVPPRMTKQVEVADIGCGFGGLLTALAPLMPDTLILGAYTRIRYFHTATTLNIPEFHLRAQSEKVLIMKQNDRLGDPRIRRGICIE